MSTASKLSGIALAAAAAAVFAALPAGTAVAAKDAKVQCFGVNACKGQAECKTAKNECKGHNACKGQGVVSMSAEECKAKGGTVKS
ncbi:MAG TPA: hypothetical protein VLW45_11600 [Pelomicrobium sp.]|nr:hypothetical protein [Pelomicrobium sp.]